MYWQRSTNAWERENVLKLKFKNVFDNSVWFGVPSWLRRKRWLRLVVAGTGPVHIAKWQSRHSRGVIFDEPKCICEEANMLSNLDCFKMCCLLFRLIGIQRLGERSSFSLWGCSFQVRYFLMMYHQDHLENFLIVWTNIHKITASQPISYDFDNINDTDVWQMHATSTRWWTSQAIANISRQFRLPKHSFVWLFWFIPMRGMPGSAFCTLAPVNIKTKAFSSTESRSC